MNYILFICFCLSAFPLLNADEHGSSIKAHGSADCIPLLTPQDIESLKEVRSNFLAFSSGDSKLTENQIKAVHNLLQQSHTCNLPKELSGDDLSLDLQALEILALEKKGPFSLDDINKLRTSELIKIDLTQVEINMLISLDPQKISNEDRALIQKYIQAVQTLQGLARFTIAQRLFLLRVIAENIGNGFLESELASLRKMELLINGLTNADIDVLNDLIHRKEVDQVLTSLEVNVLKKWILVESLLSARDLMDFKSLATLHEIIQSQSTPPFSIRELKLDNIAFQNQLKNAPFIQAKQLEILKQIAGNVTGYLSQDQGLSFFQVGVCKRFMESMFQFGRVPELTPLEVGQLLQLIEFRVEFQHLMYTLQNVRYIEFVKVNFTLDEKRILDGLRQKVTGYEKLTLSKQEVGALKVYVGKARNPGGLNGFGSPYRKALFEILKNSIGNKKSGFTLSDLEVLRRVEQQNNGFTDKDIYDLKVIGKLLQKKQKLTVEQVALIREFDRIEKQVGLGTLIDFKESEILYNRIKEPVASPSLEKEAAIYEHHQKPVALPQAHERAHINSQQVNPAEMKEK